MGGKVGCRPGVTVVSGGPTCGPAASRAMLRLRVTWGWNLAVGLWAPTSCRLLRLLACLAGGDAAGWEGPCAVVLGGVSGRSRFTARVPCPVPGSGRPTGERMPSALAVVGSLCCTLGRRSESSPWGFWVPMLTSRGAEGSCSGGSTSTCGVPLVSATPVVALDPGPLSSLDQLMHSASPRPPA